MNELLRLNLQYFAEGGQPDVAEPTAGEPQETPPAAPENDPPVKTFTQEDLDKIVADRLLREKKKFADYDDLKAKLSEYEESERARKESEMSEVEKLQAQLNGYIEKEQTLAQELAEHKERMKVEKIKGEFLKHASQNQIAYVDDAFRLADLSGAGVDEDGNVFGVEEVVKALVEEKPFLASKKQKAIGEPTNGNYDRPDKTAEQMLKEAEEKARKTGRLEDRVAYAKLKRELNKN